MNHYQTSSGERVSKKEIDKRTSEAKKQKLQEQFDEHGYNFCQECFRNDCLPLDCSHEISVDEAQKSGRSELAWDVTNIKIRGRNCHQRFDKLNTQLKWIK